MPDFDPKKAVQLRNGQKARILATDLKGQYPIVTAVEGDTLNTSGEVILCHAANGRIWAAVEHPDDFDLVNVPVKVTKWVNIYSLLPDDRFSGTGLYETKEEAVAAASGDKALVATVKVEWEE